MFLVRFYRRENLPNEEYWYNCRNDAQSHLELFKDDDSGLYSRIDLCCVNKEKELVVESLIFTG